MSDRPLRVYIAGPMTNGDGKSFDMSKINKAVETYCKLIEQGFLPHCPQLTVFCEFLHPGRISYETWMALDEEYINNSDLVLRLPGASKGADRECHHAKTRGINVIYGLDALVSLLGPQQKASV